MSQTEKTCWNGDELLAALEALANPHRLRIVTELHRRGRIYISQLARDLEISRPLLHLHLKKLESAGLVASKLELSEDGKALNWFATTDFDLRLSPATIAEASATLPSPKSTKRKAS